MSKRNTGRKSGTKVAGGRYYNADREAWERLVCRSLGIKRVGAKHYDAFGEQSGFRGMAALLGVDAALPPVPPCECDPTIEPEVRAECERLARKAWAHIQSPEAIRKHRRLILADERIKAGQPSGR